MEVSWGCSPAYSTKCHGFRYLQRHTAHLLLTQRNAFPSGNVAGIGAHIVRMHIVTVCAAFKAGKII